MPSTAPETSDRMTAMRKGTSSQVGSRVARVPIGSAGDAVLQRRVGPGQQQAVDDQDDGGDGAAEGVPPDDGGARGVAPLVARPVGGDVDPAQAEAGHHQHQRADHRLRGPAGQGLHRGPVDVLEGQQDVADGDDAGDPGEHRLHPHDDVVAGHRGRDDHQRDHGGRHDLGRRAAAPAELLEDRRGREHREDGEEGLPADRGEPGDDARAPSAR